MPEFQKVGLQFGSWFFAGLPDSWEEIEKRGIRRTGNEVFPSNVVATEEALPAGETLKKYVEAQIPILQYFLPHVTFQSAVPATIRGADEAIMIQVRFSCEDKRSAVQHQVYARAGERVGVLTFTTLELELPSVQPIFDSILDTVTFHPGRTDESQIGELSS